MRRAASVGGKNARLTESEYPVFMHPFRWRPGGSIWGARQCIEVNALGFSFWGDKQLKTGVFMSKLRLHNYV